MVLTCDVCRGQIHSSPINTTAADGISDSPIVALFPCFHKHCARCRDAVNQQQQQHGRISCKVCGCQCLPSQIYDHTETQLERIFCMHCSVKNRAPVEWYCETCQQRFLCNTCSKLHVVQGHSLTPAKPSLPLRSQCHSHLNTPATYMCSCQTRLCVHCLNIHANGQLVPPHEQRYPYAQLAEQARIRLQDIRTNSGQECARLDKLLPMLQRNRKCVHDAASKARSDVAEQVVELCNAVIRRGNDIVTHIDRVEQEKMQKLGMVERELKHVVERFKKIEDFSENALVMTQQDHPGMHSAGEFAYSAVVFMGKKLEGVRREVELMGQRMPTISYQSDLTQLTNALRSLGVVDVDGQKTIPPQLTSKNARMFNVNNAGQLSATGGNARPSAVHSQSQNPPGGTTIRQGPALIRPNLSGGGPTSSASSSAQAQQWPPNVGVVHPAPQQQMAVSGRMMNGSQVRSANFIPTSIAGAAGNGILTHLLQQNVQPIPISQSNISLPNTPTTPNFPHASAMVAPQQQQSHQQVPLSQQQMAYQQQQQQLAQRQQQQQQMATRNQQQMMQQQAITRQQQQHLNVQQNQVQQNQLILQQLQAQQQQFFNQQQQQQRMQQQQTQQHSQKQTLQQQPQQVLLQNIPMGGGDVPSTSADCNNGRLLLRIPNPYRQQAPPPPQQQQQQPMIPASPVESPTIQPQPRLISANQPPVINMSMVIPFSSSAPLIPISQQQQQHFGTLIPISSIGPQQQHPNIYFQQQPTNIHFQQLQQPQLAAGQQQISQQQNFAARPILVELADEEETNTGNQGQQSSTSGVGDGLLTNTANIRPKAQSAAADSTVNGGGSGSSGDDSSVSPSPSVLNNLKRHPSASGNEPTHKRPALERVVQEEENRQNGSSSPSSTMIDGGTSERQNQKIDGRKRTHNDGNEKINSQRSRKTEDASGHSGTSSSKLELGSPDRNIRHRSSLNKRSHSSTPNSSPSGSGSSGKPRGDDLWDDYCYVCFQGCDETTGSLGCCETCPRVFHARCHVPLVDGAMEDLPDDWRCSICLPSDPLTQISQTFGEREKLLCAKVFLACFEDNTQVEPFLNAVSEDEAEYYAVIREPIWLTEIARKISVGEYALISEFIENMNLLFRNCSTFNPPTHPLSNSGKQVYTLYMNAVRKFLPAYEKQIWVYVSLYSARHSIASSSDEESSRRRNRRAVSQQKAKSQTPADI